MGDLVAKCRDILSKYWDEVTGGVDPAADVDTNLPADLISYIARCINSNTKSYRYVLPTQLLAKLADPTLDSRCLQASRGGAGAFDARTVAHRVIVPFCQANHGVLGGSSEPYVNNPLRVPEVSGKHCDPQKNKNDWDAQCHVLDAVEQTKDPVFASAVYRQVLKDVWRR